MKLIETFRNPEHVKKIVDSIHSIVDTKKEYKIMEVCGTHTMSIARFGIREILPQNVKLVSGPGCPVCVIPQGEIDAIFSLIEQYDVTVATFGDLMKVPGSKGETLLSYKANGASIKIIFSPLDVVTLSREMTNPVVFIGIGFETTAPAIAALGKKIIEKDFNDIFIFPYNKTMPEVLKLLLLDKNLNIDGFICPGHVSVVTGESIYTPIVKAGKAAVIGGFEPVDILISIFEIIKQVNSEMFNVKNLYKRAVKNCGNIAALRLIDDVFETVDSAWRGIGIVKKSGLAFKGIYERLNVFNNFSISVGDYIEKPGCKCGDVLKGYISPSVCPLMGNGCTPEKPYGPCMVSSEGACSAYYKYNMSV